MYSNRLGLNSQTYGQRQGYIHFHCIYYLCLFWVGVCVCLGYKGKGIDTWKDGQINKDICLFPSSNSCKIAPSPFTYIYKKHVPKMHIAPIVKLRAFMYQHQYQSHHDIHMYKGQYKFLRNSRNSVRDNYLRKTQVRILARTKNNSSLMDNDNNNKNQKGNNNFSFRKTSNKELKEIGIDSPNRKIPFNFNTNRELLCISSSTTANA